MTRSNSLDSITSSSNSTPNGSSRTLKKKSSLAELAKKHLRRFKSKGDFDFGCQGDSLHESEQEGRYEEEEEDDVEETRQSPTPMTSSPSRPQLASEVLDESQFSASQLRDLRRQKEEALAASACLEYIQTTRSHQQHRRQHSRTHSLTSSSNPFSLSPALERLNLHDRDQTITSSGPRHGRSESNSSISSASVSQCSSRPRTNDSLPSFASTTSSDLTSSSSYGSFPPSPVQTSRPTFSGVGGGGGTGTMMKKNESIESAASQPRAYAFI
ncbi:uncharacterized protein JCM6883_003144 [Sporobolomyces salmoneus]|uniref:uncharacterized protein n=1 Tax=Sporobolomyces salmoneus TaxID=183962 RepID=UPI00317C6B3D